MAEADDQPKRCPCGFWGSASTMNLCSQCYKEHMQKISQTSASNDNANANKTAAVASSSLLTGLLSIPSGSTSTTTSPLSMNDDYKDDINQPEAKKMELEEDATDNNLQTDMPIQKNKKKCWICRVKLELAQRELGQCRCGYVFCLLHRLPEQHDCIFDHKDSGRQEAMKNMVATGRKKIGRSFHRMDSKA